VQAVGEEEAAEADAPSGAGGIRQMKMNETARIEPIEEAARRLSVPNTLPSAYYEPGDADETPVYVDSLDDMQPVPRAGKFFAERILREEIRTDAGVILQEGEDPAADDTRTKRARVLQLGPAREGEAWDIEVGWNVIVPYHAGNVFEWMSQEGITESLWIIDTNEVIAIFRPR
jgi:hypothetical protein